MGEGGLLMEMDYFRATGTVETHFEGRYTRFENLSQRSDGPPPREY